MSAAVATVDYVSPVDPATGRAAMLWVARIARERQGLDAATRVFRGYRTDELSRAAFAAWRQRWWRQEEGRARRIGHYALAAEDQVRPDLADLDAVRGSKRLSIMPLGAARGLTPKSGAFWQPGEPKEDRWLATLPLFDETPATLYALDILAWYPRDPLKWWCRTGAGGPVLGEHRLAAALMSEKPVRVYRTPQAWNRAGGGGAPGCCILDWDSNPGLETRAFARALVGDDVAHARELQRMLDKRRPKVQMVTGRGRR